MLPYLIAGVIGYGISKLFEDNKAPKYTNGGLIAPNGKPSNLTPEQYKLVRTLAFKKWFGDWENDPENSSKVVDSNGEPLVVYHGSNNRFNKFNLKNFGRTDNGYFGIGFYFTPQLDYAEYYGKSNPKKKQIILECFLNIRNPTITFTEKDWVRNYSDGLLYFINFNNVKYLREVLALKPNQIKLADGTNTTFDGSNPDIRFDGGGAINKSNDFIGTWEELKKYNPNLWETGILRRSQNPQGATDIIPKDVFIRQFQWQNYGQYDEIEAETIYGEPDNYGYYNDKDGNPITDERTGNYITDELDYENNAERIKATISNKQLKNNLIDSFQTQEGKEYLKKVIATLPKNEDGTITAYRIGTIGEDLQSYTLSEGMAKTFSNQGTDIMPSGLPSIPNEGYKDYGVLPVNKVKINPKGIVAWSPYDSEILVELKYIKTDNSKNSYSDGGSVLLAPNGKPSNLTPEQYKLVRTPAFKEWFGDWENDPANSSKVVDENGEPLVVYHGSPNEFFVFKIQERAYFFSKNKKNAENFVLSFKNVKDIEITIYNVFLNIRNLFNGKNLSEIEKEKIKIYVDNITNKQDLLFGVYWDDIKNDVEPNSDSDLVLDILNNTHLDSWHLIESYAFQKWLKSENYDGFLVSEIGFNNQNFGLYNSKNIKLADGTNTTFDGNNPDIRFMAGGITQPRDLNQIVNIQNIYKGADYYSYSDNLEKQEKADRWFELFITNQKERQLTAQEFSEFMQLSNELIWDY